MGDLKPIGSEKLQGQDKLKRIMEIARFKETVPSVINETSKSEYTRTLADGNNYEIVKERQGYIIKRTITESGTDYMEPMKNRKYYSSYSQALKRLNLVAGELNRLNENETEVSMFGEQKKFTLKTPKPAAVPMEVSAPPMAPPPVPAPELPASPNSEMGMEDDMDLDIDSEEMAPEGDVEDIEIEEPNGGDEGEVTFKTIQKLTGKLTQKIRTLENQEGMTSEDIKYVINMVIASLDLKSLSEEDKEDIMEKFEESSEDLEGEDMGGDDMDGEDLTDDSEVEDIQSDMDIAIEGEMEEEDEDEDDFGNGAIFDSIFGESKVDKVLSKYFEVSKKEILENKQKIVVKNTTKLSDVRKKMGEVVKLTETIEQELASQKFLQKNSSAKIVGKTNKNNLVFENKGVQVRITPEGQIL
jgi:hypothetical protein